MGLLEDKREQERRALLGQYKQATSQVMSVGSILPEWAGGAPEPPPPTAFIGSRPDTAGKPDIQGERFNQFIRENQVTPPARAVEPPSLPVNREADVAFKASQIQQQQIAPRVGPEEGTLIQSALWPLELPVAAGGMIAGKAMGDPETVKSSARALAPAILRGKQPAITDEIMGAVGQEYAASVDPNLPLEERIPRSALGSVGVAALALSPGDVAGFTPELARAARPMNALARKLHERVLRTAKEAPLFSGVPLTREERIKAAIDRSAAEGARLKGEDAAVAERAAETHAVREDMGLGPERAEVEMQRIEDAPSVRETRAPAAQSRPGRTEKIPKDVPKAAAQGVANVSLHQGEWLADAEATGMITGDRLKAIKKNYDELRSVLGDDDPITKSALWVNNEAQQFKVVKHLHEAKGAPNAAKERLIAESNLSEHPRNEGVGPPAEAGGGGGVEPGPQAQAEAGLRQEVEGAAAPIPEPLPPAITPEVRSDLEAAFQAAGKPEQAPKVLERAEEIAAKVGQGDLFEPLGPFQPGGTTGVEGGGGPSRPFGRAIRRDPPEVGNYLRETTGQKPPPSRPQPLLSNLLDKVVGRSFRTIRAKATGFMDEFRQRYLDFMGRGQQATDKWEGALKSWAQSLPEKTLSELDTPLSHTPNARMTPYRLSNLGDAAKDARTAPLDEWAMESGLHRQNKELGQRTLVDVRDNIDMPEELVSGVKPFRATGQLPQAIHPEVAATIQARPSDPQIKAFRDAVVEVTVKHKERFLAKGDPDYGKKLAEIQRRTEDAADEMISTLSELKSTNEIEQRVAQEFERTLILPDQFRYKDRWIDGTIHRLTKASTDKPGYIDSVPRKIAMQTAWDETFGQNLGKLDARALAKYAKENPTAPLPRNENTILGQYRDEMGRKGLDPTNLDKLLAATQHETQTFLGHSVGTLPSLGASRTLPIDTAMGRASYWLGKFGRDVGRLASSATSVLGSTISNLFQPFAGTSGMVRGGAARGGVQTIREGLSSLKSAAKGKDLLEANISSQNTVRRWSMVNAASDELMGKGRIEKWSEKMAEWSGRNYAYRVGATNAMKAGRSEFENLLGAAKTGDIGQHIEGLRHSVGLSDRWAADMRELAIVGQDNEWGQLLRLGLEREFLGQYVRQATWYGQQAAMKKGIQFGGWKQLFNPFIDPAAQMWSRTQQILNDIYRNPQSLQSYGRLAKFGSGAVAGAYMTAVARQAFTELSGLEGLTASEKRKAQTFVQKINQYALWQIFAGGPVADVLEGSFSKGPKAAIKDAFTPFYAKMAGQAVDAVTPTEGFGLGRELLTKMIIPMVTGKVLAGGGTATLGAVRLAIDKAVEALSPKQLAKPVEETAKEVPKEKDYEPLFQEDGLYKPVFEEENVYQPMFQD